MGMIEEARVNLGQAKAQNESAAAIATVQALIAVVESLDGLHELLSELVQKVDQVDSAVMMIANEK